MTFDSGWLWRRASKLESVANYVKIAVSAGLVGAAVIGAPTASADSRFNGTYTVVPAKGTTSTWTVSSDCETEGCMAHVVSSAGWAADFQLTGGNWVGRTNAPVSCLTGTHDVPWTFTIDATSLSGGTAITDPNPFCIPFPMHVTLIGAGSPGAAPAPQPAPGVPAPGVPVPPPGGQPYDPNIFVPGFEPGRLFPNLPGTGGMPTMPQW